MKTWKKVAIALTVVILLAAVIGFTVSQAQKGVAEVQTGKVTKQDIASQVTASGEIKPKTYVNVGANGMGRITHLYVKEGDHVKKGQVLATLDNIQSEADVAANKAALEAARTDLVANQAALKTAIADVARAKADNDHAELDWKRADQLYKDQLIPKSDYDTKKAAWESGVSNLAQAESRVAQARAQAESSERRIKQQDATLRRSSDVLSKTVYEAPYDGVVTNLPVREGETVVVGIQNAEGSTLMTLADMSVVTAEVKVDETDIVNIRLGQTAEVTVDALPGKSFKGHVTLVGDQALLRSTGIATSQSTTGTEEAKDFKVVVTLDEASDELRPGLSTTAKITTARKASVLSLPIQALTMHDPALDNQKPGTVQAASPAPKSNPVQGVFVIDNKGGKLRASFVPVKTGITGATDIEVTDGLKEGQEIVTGPFKTLRGLKSGALIKRDTPKPATPGAGSNS